MNRPTFLKIDFDQVLQRNFFQDPEMELPYSEELEAAVGLIEGLVKAKKQQIVVCAKEEFLAKKYENLKLNINDPKRSREILHEILMAGDEY